MEQQDIEDVIRIIGEGTNGDVEARISTEKR